MDQFFGLCIFLFIGSVSVWGVFSFLEWIFGKRVILPGMIVGGRYEPPTTDSEGDSVSEKFILKVKVGNRQIEVETNEKYYNSITHHKKVNVSTVVGAISKLHYLPRIL